MAAPWFPVPRFSVPRLPALDWMSRPFAHRGLHDAQKGIIENTPSAVQAAINKGYGIEVDLRLAACGTVMVFHDRHLERLMRATGEIGDQSAAQLQALSFRGTNDRMMSLADLLDLTSGRVPLLLEIKSDWPRTNGPVHEFATRIIATLKGYHGALAVMSFDPAFVCAFRSLAPHIPRGLVAERFGNARYWRHLSMSKRLSLRFLLSTPRSRPHFIAYDINALPALAPLVARKLFKRPLLTWTVRTNQQAQRAQDWCDAMIFEGFEPDANGPLSFR